ncbi:MAG: hypothetical protein E6F99_22855 [Actinobacteria bacterium]|nr:MAG: hypothetical protein E6F99_22855 [Actinomycetota bacterium]
MVYPLPLAGVGGSVDAPDGYTYAAALVRLARGDVLAALREVRFTGWLARPEDGWLVAVARSGAGVTAAHGRGVVGVGEWLAGRLCATVLAVRVLADRQLALVAWADGTEIGRYVSDPSHGLPADEDVLAEPLGVEHAAAFAEACGRPETADDLAELLAETLDPDSVIESERLGRVLRLLGLPTWLVAAAALPRDVPTGPVAAEVTRLGAGVPGLRGRFWGRAVEVVRRRRRPPPVVADPPRATAAVDPWVL